MGLFIFATAQMSFKTGFRFGCAKVPRYLSPPQQLVFFVDQLHKADMAKADEHERPVMRSATHGDAFLPLFLLHDRQGEAPTSFDEPSLAASNEQRWNAISLFFSSPIGRDTFGQEKKTG